ncbi:hypothetical protein [Vibrio cholerae]
MKAIKLVLLVIASLFIAFLSVLISMIFVALVVDLLGGAYDAFN